MGLIFSNNDLDSTRLIWESSYGQVYIYMRVTSQYYNHYKFYKIIESKLAIL